MSTYSVALFFHIVGVVGAFVELALEWTGLWQIRSAGRPEQVRTWIGMIKGANRLGMVAWLTILASGLYMMVTAWGPMPWLLVTLGAVALVSVLSFAVAGPRIAAIGRAIATDKAPGSGTFRSLAKHPLLWISIQTQVVIALAIVFLKTAKPDLIGSLLALGAAIVLGLASAIPVRPRERVREGLAD